MQYNVRREKLKRFLKKNSFDAFFIHGIYDILYLTGFFGSHSFLVITKKKSYLLVDGRYYEWAQKVIYDELEVILLQDPIKDLEKILKNLKLVAFDSEDLKVSLYNKLCENLKSVRFVPLSSSPVKALRAIKDEEEVRILREAAKVSKRIFNNISKDISVGLTERELWAKINYNIEVNANGRSFDTIVLSGNNTSLPHGIPGDNLIKENDCVLIDYGLKWKNYCSDHTRVIFLGKNSMEKYYRIVKKAFKIALEHIRPGVEIGKIDKAVKSFFSSFHLEKNFVHSTGHGIGLEVHEYPVINVKNKGRLKEGMVITIEPGLYFPGEGGVRFEEMVLVTKDGFDVL